MNEWDEFETVSTDDALASLVNSGVVITSGFRTEDDVKRLKREGYTPASSGGHLNGDGVDLVPGKSGMTLEQLAVEARQRFGPKAIIGIHNGSHVDVKVPGWGNAPDVYRADPWDAFPVEKSAPKKTVATTDYSEMTGDRSAVTVAPKGSEFRTVDDPDAATMLDRLIREGASYGDAIKSVSDRFPGEYQPFSPTDYAAAVKYHGEHPDYQGSFASAMKYEPLTESEKQMNDAAQSGVGVAVGKFANAALAGAPVALAGEEGNYWSSLADEEFPIVSTAADIAGNVAGAIGLGKAVGVGAEALGAGESVLAPAARAVAAHPNLTSSAIDIGMGGTYGAAEAGPGHRLEGAAYGAGTTLGLDFAARKLLAPAIGAGAEAVRGARAPNDLGEAVTTTGPLEQRTAELTKQSDAPDPQAALALQADQPLTDEKTEKLAQQIRDHWSFQKEGGHRRLPIQVVRTEDGRIRTWAASGSDRAVQNKFYPEDGDTIVRLRPDDEPALAALIGRGPVVSPPQLLNRAANINLSKIDTPEDIDALMKQTVESFDEFKLERRGVQTWDATEKLAKDLGMTPDDLLARRTGQAFNAEQALGARNLLAASAEETRNLAAKAVAGGETEKAAFVKSFFMHAAITEKAAGAAAEAGRALNIYRKVAKAGLADKNAIQDAMKRLQDGASIDDLVHMVDSLKDDPTALNRFARDAIKPSMKDKLMFVWINSLLSGPKTHVVNVTSNLLTGLMDAPEHLIAAGIGAVRKIAGSRGDAVLMSEIGPRLYGTLRGAADALEAAKKGWSEEASSGKLDAIKPAIGGTAGKIIGIPTRLLNVEDEMFKAMARRSEMAGIAVRKANGEGLKGEALKSRIDDLMQNPTEEMKLAAAEAALYRTFQRPLGPAMQKVSNAINNVAPLKLFIPFIRTPTNLLKYAIERTPASPLLKEVRSDFIAGGAKRDLATARMILGTGIGMTVAGLVSEGKITGNGPADPSARKALEADGWQPYSLKVGDEYISYRRLDPWATIIGSAADAIELQSAMTDKQRQDAGAIIIGAATQNLASKTWLSGLSDLIDTITNPQMNAKSTLTRLASSIATPTLSSQVAQMVDPIQRDTQDPTYLGTIRKKIESRLPGKSEDLIPRRDILGKEIRNEGGALARLISPFDTRQLRRDPVAKAIYDSGARFSLPSREVGGGRLTDKDYNNYQQVAAQRFYDTMAETLADPEWLTMTRDEQRKEIEKIKNRSRKDARADLFGVDR